MSPPRFIVPRSMIERDRARLTGAELHHLRAVMRLAAGDEVALIDDADREYHGVIESCDSDHAIIALTPIAPAAAARRHLILAAAIIKGPRMDFLVEKAAELGARELLPLLSERAVVRDPGASRLARWRRLADSAVKQSLTSCRMAVREPQTVAALAAGVPQNSLAILCSREGAPLGSILKGCRPEIVMLVCGPEGGFTADEIALLRASNFRPAAFGPNRLRSETAALAALSVTAAALDEISRSE